MSNAHAPVPSLILFGFDHSKRSLVYLSHETGKPTLISTAKLRELGYKADDAEFRNCLPRTDPPMVIPGSIIPPMPPDGFNGRRR